MLRTLWVYGSSYRKDDFEWQRAVPVRYGVQCFKWAVCKRLIAKLFYMYCTNCGTKLGNEAKFCTKCGARTDGEVGVATAVSKTDFMGRFFGGRLGRMRYFEGLLFAFLPLLVLVSLWGIINLASPDSGSADTAGALIPLLIVVGLLFFFFLHFSVAIRRCHDFGYSGWLSVCSLIPYLGLIFGLIFLFKKGDDAANKYGSSPVQRSFLEDIFSYKK